MNGLRPRPEATAGEVAAVTAAYHQWRSSLPVLSSIDRTPVWRFSGRWYAAKHR